MGKRYYQAPDKDNPDPELRTDAAWWCETSSDHAESPTVWIKRIHPSDVASQVPAELLAPSSPAKPGKKGKP